MTRQEEGSAHSPRVPFTGHPLCFLTANPFPWDTQHKGDFAVCTTSVACDADRHLILTPSALVTIHRHHNYHHHHLRLLFWSSSSWTFDSQSVQRQWSALPFICWTSVLQSATLHTPSVEPLCCNLQPCTLHLLNLCATIYKLAHSICWTSVLQSATLHTPSVEPLWFNLQTCAHHLLNLCATICNLAHSICWTSVLQSANLHTPSVEPLCYNLQPCTPQMFLRAISYTTLRVWSRSQGGWREAEPTWLWNQMLRGSPSPYKIVFTLSE